MFDLEDKVAMPCLETPGIISQSKLPQKGWECKTETKRELEKNKTVKSYGRAGEPTARVPKMAPGKISLARGIHCCPNICMSFAWPASPYCAQYNMAAYKMAAVKVTPPNDFSLSLIRSHMVVIHLFLMLCDL